MATSTTWAGAMALKNTNVFFYAQFGGIPKYFCTYDPTTRPAVASRWTTTGYTWHECMRAGDIKSSACNINRQGGMSTTGTTTLTLHEDNAGSLMSLFSFYNDATLRAKLQTAITELDVPASPNININITTASFPTTGDVYIGNETITIGAVDADTRAITARKKYNSDANTYSITTNDDNVIDGPEITSAPETWENRKLYIWMNVMDANGNPMDNAIDGLHQHLIFKGFIRSLEPSNLATEWKITAHDVLAVLDKKILLNPTKLNMINDVIGLGVNSTPLDVLVYETPETWMDATFPIASDVNSKLYISTVISGTAPFFTSKTGCAGQIIAEINKQMADIAFTYSGHSYAVDRTSADIYNSAVEFDTPVAASIGDYNHYTNASPVTVTIDEKWYGSGLKPSAVLGSKSITIPRAYEPGTISEIPIGREFNDSEVYIISDNYVEIKEGNWSLQSDNPCRYVQINDKEIVEINAKITSLVSKYAHEIVFRENPIGKAGRESHVAPHSASGKRAYNTATQCLYFENDPFYKIFLTTALSFNGLTSSGGNDIAYDRLPPGLGSKIPNEYFDQKSIRNAFNKLGEANKRSYLITKPMALKELIQEEAKTTGIYFILNSDFEISAITPDITKETTPFSIDHTNMVGEAGLNINIEGIVNQIIFDSEWDDASVSHTDQISINDLQSQQRYQTIKSISIKNKGIRIPEGEDEVEFISGLAFSFLKQLSDARPYVTCTCDRTAFGVNVGDFVTFTQNVLPNWRSGARGFTDEWFFVSGVKRDYDKMTVSFTLTAEEFKNQKRGKLTPCAKVVSYNNATKEITVEANEYTSSPDTDIGHFTVGDKIRIWDKSAGSYLSVTGAKAIAIIAGNVITHGSTGYDDDGDPPVAGDIVQFAQWDDVITAHQKTYVYVADFTSPKDITQDGDDAAPFLYT